MKRASSFEILLGSVICSLSASGAYEAACVLLLMKSVSGRVWVKERLEVLSVKVQLKTINADLSVFINMLDAVCRFIIGLAK